MSSISEQYDYVVGVDTHAQAHEYVIVAASTGAVIAGPEKFPVTAHGFGKAITWIGRRTEGSSRVLAAVEGTNSYGRTLTKELAEVAIAVTEAQGPSKKVRRGTGKTDGLDALRAARAVLVRSIEDLLVPRQGQVRTELQVLLISRRLTAQRKTAVINALNAVVRTLGLLADTRKKLSDKQIRAIAGGSLTESGYSPIVVGEATDLAATIVACNEELRVNERRLREVVSKWRPDLLDVVGVGPIVAARILVVWSHEGRFADDARFASIAGVSPVPIGSGQSMVWRLNYGGDRQLNSAIHTIMLTRRQHDEDTKKYIVKRTAQGKTSRAINRLLKRYITREIFKLLEHGLLAEPDQPNDREAPTAA